LRNKCIEKFFLLIRRFVLPFRI